MTEALPLERRRLLHRRAPAAGVLHHLLERHRGRGSRRRRHHRRQRRPDRLRRRLGRGGHQRRRAAVAAAQGRPRRHRGRRKRRRTPRPVREVAATFFLLAAYIAFEAGSALLEREEPDRSTVGLVLSVLSLAIMPVLAWRKQRTGRQMGSRALVADSVETWVCSYLSLALLAGVGMHALYGWWWADSVGALAMLPVVLWQGWETLSEAREHEDEDQE